MITRQQALKFLNKKLEGGNIIKHMLATEALMAGVYEFLKTRGETDFDGNKEEWMMAGLLHDGDYCNEVPPKKQGVQITKWLKKEGYEIPDNVAQAMAAHNFATGVKPQSLMDWALFCGDSLTGLIVASALVLPSRKLSDLTVDSVLNRFKEKNFAKGTRREEISQCEDELDIPLPEFVKIVLGAMQKIAPKLGL